MAIETFTWRTQIQAGLLGDFNYTVREASFGDGYQQIVGDGLHYEKQSWPVTLTGDKEEILQVLEFLRRHIKISPLSSQVMTVTATFNQAYAP